MIGPLRTASNDVRETSDGPRLRACLSIGPVQIGSYSMRETSDLPCFRAGQMVRVPMIQDHDPGPQGRPK